MRLVTLAMLLVCATSQAEDTADRKARERAQMEDGKKREAERKQRAERDEVERQAAMKQAAADEANRQAEEARKAIEKQEARKAWLLSEPGLYATACSLRDDIADADATIARERRVGKASGFVNAAVLRQAGAMKIDAQGHMREVAAQYKQLTKKVLRLDAKRCAEFGDAGDEQ